MFPVYVGKCLSRKAIPPCWQTFRWWGRDWNGDAEVAETRVKGLLCCGFRRTGKAIGQVYQCWWRICREINVFPTFEYHIFYVLYPFVSYLLTVPGKFTFSNILHLKSSIMIFISQMHSLVSVIQLIDNSHNRGTDNRRYTVYQLDNLFSDRI
jgi:hypothetical protein